MKELVAAPGCARVASRALYSLILALPLLSACGSRERAPPPYEANPSPKEAYEVVVTTHDAPEDMYATTAYVTYKIADEGCLPPIDNFEGVRYGLEQYSLDVPLERIDATTFKGTFFRDGVLSRDYFERGACRWKVERVGTSLRTESTKSFTYFTISTTLEDGKETRYTSKIIEPLFSEGRVRAAKVTSESGFLKQVPENLRSNYFSITISTLPRKDKQ